MQAILELLWYLIIGAIMLIHNIAKFMARCISSIPHSYMRNTVRVLMIVSVLILASYNLYLYDQRDIRAYEKLLPNKENIVECQGFIQDFPNSSKVPGVESFIRSQYSKELDAAKTITQLESSIDKYSNNYRYEEKYKQSYLDVAVRTLNEKKEEIRKQEERVKRLEEERKRTEQQAWKTDKGAWDIAQAMNTSSAYRDYLSLYPKGKYAKQAEQKLIDVEVADVFASGNFGRLPSMDRIGFGKSNSSLVTVTNDTQYTLTLLYSGVESKRLVIAARGTKSIRLKSGFYKIAASVSASNVRSFAGTENLTGGEYRASYYIQTSRY